MLFDSLDYAIHILGILTLHDAVGKRGAVVDRGEFATQVLFEHIGIVERTNQLIYDVSLLVGEVDELRDILEIGTLLAKTIYSAFLLMHHKTHLLEGVDIAINRAIGCVESLRQLLHGVAVATRHHLHQNHLHLFHFDVLLQLLHKS